MRRVAIEWEPGSTVTGITEGPSEGAVGVLLAHGAGAGQSHPFMLGLRSRIASAGIGTMSFDYPYMEAGRRAPDRLPRLLQCHRAALSTMAAAFDRVVVAGKSMGGRVGGHLVAEDGGADRLVFYGYPLVPVGATAARETRHLETVSVPMLFVQGERDRLAPLAAITEVVDRLPGARLETVPEGDHSYRVPKRTGLDSEAVLDLIAGWTVEFVSG